MKKNLTAIFMAAAMGVTVLAGCGSSQGQAASESTNAQETATAGGSAESSAASEEEEQEFVLKLATTKSSENYMYKGMEMFKEKAEELTGGKVVVELYPNSQLGGQNEIMEGLGLGTIEMSLLGPSILENYYPAAAIPSTLFLAEDEEHQLAIWESDYGQEIVNGIIENCGIRCLGFCIEGMRNVWTTVPIEKLEDTKGVKLRVPELSTYINVFEALGFNPTPMAMSEVYTGLQTGIVEGLENDTSTILSNSFSDLCKYCYQTKHSVSVMTFGIADAKWQQMSKSQQEALTEASAYACDWLNEQYYAELEKSITQLEADGVTFVEVSDEDRAAIEELMEPVVANLIDGIATEEDLDALRALAD